MTNNQPAAFEAAGQRCITSLERLGWPVNKLTFSRSSSLPPPQANPAAERAERLAKSGDREIAAHGRRLAAELAAGGAANSKPDPKVAGTTAVMENYTDEIRRAGYPVDSAIITAVAKDSRVLFEYESGFEQVVQARVDLDRYERVAKSTNDREIASMYRERAKKIRAQLNEQGVRV